MSPRRFLGGGCIDRERGAGSGEMGDGRWLYPGSKCALLLTPRSPLYYKVSRDRVNCR